MDIINLFLESLILNILMWASIIPSFVTIAMELELYLFFESDNFTLQKLLRFKKSCYISVLYTLL